MNIDLIKPEGALSKQQVRLRVLVVDDMEDNRVLLRFALQRKGITVLTLAGGFASTVFWPLTQALIAALGWRHALLVLAFSVLSF